MTEEMSVFAGAAVALYAAHHVGDYWVQTDHQARHKGAAGFDGVMACLGHVASYLLTQLLFLAAVTLVTGHHWGPGMFAALAVSGITHYLADRREHGVMFWLARKIPGKAAFLAPGVPRPGIEHEKFGPCETCRGSGVSYAEGDGGRCRDCQSSGRSLTYVGDNPSLGTGAWALDQAWHIFWGVFVAALLLAGLS